MPYLTSLNAATINCVTLDSEFAQNTHVETENLETGGVFFGPEEQINIGMESIRISNLLTDGHGCMSHPQVRLHEIITHKVIFETAKETRIGRSFWNFPGFSGFVSGQQ